MQIVLAGYNLDAEVLAELLQAAPRADATPETLSAAYARISRDPRPITELRRAARQEVEKARRSNANIIFKMGHHSVAEHAVFNFDLIDVSRLALEEIEKFRLCSYTEKSQRYQKLEGNFIVPEEIRTTNHEPLFTSLLAKQNKYYGELLARGIEAEDARYVTPLATTGQVGMTLNARNLELLLRRFASSQLAEVRQIGQTMYELVSKIAPSIILFTAANDFDGKTYAELRAGVKGNRKRKLSARCQLVDYTRDADLKLIAALLHTSTGTSFINCRRLAKALSKKERLEFVKKACRHMEFYDSTLREFEHVVLTYDLVMSSSCFGQMKRHRLATITSQPYQVELGVTVPPKLRAAGEENNYLRLMAETEEVFRQLAATVPAAAPYVLTGAHRKRSLLTVNARELYHISRLREDSHAQWEIREVSAELTQFARRVMPLTMLTIGGKDSYVAVYRQVFGREPKIAPPKE
ncbi:MAG: FAD-dependent thymidylate synthase [Candidatus Margulisiibacteriota bacterium]